MLGAVAEASAAADDATEVGAGAIASGDADATGEGVAARAGSDSGDESVAAGCSDELDEQPESSREAPMKLTARPRAKRETGDNINRKILILEWQTQRIKS